MSNATRAKNKGTARGGAARGNQGITDGLHGQQHQRRMAGWIAKGRQALDKVEELSGCGLAGTGSRSGT